MSKKWRDDNRMAVDKLQEAGIYNETLRNIVEELGILPDRATTRDSHFVLQDIEGNQRTAEEIIRRLQTQEIGLTTNSDGSIIANVGDFRNDARSNSAKKGIVEVDIKNLVRPNKNMKGWSPQTMSGVNGADAVHRARFLPDQELVLNNEDTQRAQRIGLAEATGDLQLIHEANTMYDFPMEVAQEIGRRVLIGNQTLRDFVKNKGIAVKGRFENVIDPVTKLRLGEMDKDQRDKFLNDRGDNLVKRWLDTGMRSIGDGRAEVHVPGFHSQMEHQNPFSKSIDVLGDKSTYLSDSIENQIGFLERYENAEKNDLNTEDYHAARRAKLLAENAGISNLELGKTLTGSEAIGLMIADKLPPVKYSDAPRKIDRGGEIDNDNLILGYKLQKDINRLYNKDF